MAVRQQTNRSSGAVGAAVPRLVLVIIGPSASGKSSLVRELHRRRVVRTHPTWTTRPRRDDEHGGSLEHRFASDAEFDELCARGHFLATAALPGLPHRYGLAPLPADPGPVDTVILRAPFVESFGRLFPDRLVYHIEDTVHRTRQRLLLRGCPPSELAARLDGHHHELAAGRRLAHRVLINDCPLPALADAAAATLRLDLTQRPIHQGGFAC
jgi:ribose 1,5-bisphosphokinase PhnN